MTKFLKALIAYVVFWFIFFIFARSYFLITHYREALHTGLNNIAGTFTHGLKLDISTTAYILIIPLLASLFFIWIKGRWYSKFIKFYTWLILLISAVIIVTDSVLYTYWGFRMDYTPFIYLKTPREAAASVTTFQILYLSLIVILVTMIFVILYKKYVNRFFPESIVSSHKIPVTIFL